MTEPTDAELIAELEAAGVSFLAFLGGMSGAKKVWTTSGSQDAKKIAAGMRAAIAKWGTPPVVAGEPVDRADAVNLARNALTHYDCAITKKGVRVLAEAVLSMDAALTTPQPTQAQAGAVPLDEARRLFDAGWKAAARFCDSEDVVADGIIGFGACPQFEAAFAAANGIKGGQHAE